jgi:predicted DNA-binding WGR domain protein
MRPTKNICTGYALHYFDAGLGQRGSDKFYRAFFYENNGNWFSILHWGRDGTTGQAKVEAHADEHVARKHIEKKRTEKVRHGYEALGEGQHGLDITKSATTIGEEFALFVSNRAPDKSRMTGSYLIHEEPDLMDLLS